MSAEQKDGDGSSEQLSRLPLPVAKRTTIDAALASLTEQMLINARHSRLPLFAWLAKHGTAFFFGGAMCRFILEREAIAQTRKLTRVTKETMTEFDRILKSRQEEFLQLNITDIHQVPTELAPSFGVWKPENPALMDFLAYDMPGRLAMGGYTPPEIGSAQAGALLTYEISRMQETQLK